MSFTKFQHIPPAGVYRGQAELALDQYEFYSTGSGLEMVFLTRSQIASRVWPPPPAQMVSLSWIASTGLERIRDSR